MNLSKNGRKTQKAINRALMLGLPIAGLLVTVGCERKARSESSVKKVSEEQVQEIRPFERPTGSIIPRPDGDFGSDVGGK